MLSVATILKPQGLKGELKCRLLTDVLAVFTKSKSVFIKGKEFNILKASVRQDFLYITLEGISDRIEAEKYRNKDIEVPKEVIDKFSGGKLLIDDLIGMNLYDENGEFVGQVVDYDAYCATGFVTVLQDNHDYQMPFIDEIFKVQGKNVTVIREAFDRYKI